MERLSGLDASFLYLESRAQLMHVSGILELDPATVEGGYRFEDLRNELARRITAMPAFRRKLHDSVMNLDHPVWVEDDDFDIEAHVHRVAVPAPGGEVELAELCAHVAGLPLDRSRPLWEMWVIEGVASGSDPLATLPASPSGRIAVMMRMHHACVDGVTGAGLMAQLCSLTPEPPPLDPEMVGRSTGSASVLELAADGAKNVLLRPLSLVSLLPRTLPVPLRWWHRSRRGEAMPAPFSAPRTSLNSAITGNRTIAFCSVPLPDVKRIKDHFGVKVNDVVLAAVSGAMRQFLHDRGELPPQPLVAMIPVSVHEAEIGATLVEGTNKVTGMFTRLTTDVDGPVERLEAIRARVSTSKDHHGEMDDNLLRSWAQFAPSSIMQLGAKLYGDKNLPDLHPVVYNLVISNVPGPDIPLYFLGARIHAMYPLGPVFHGAGLNVTVFSQEGTLNLGVIACKQQVPDPWPIVRAFERDIAALLTAVDDGPAATSEDGDS
ncbi:wax ester/triacylglycerol synthase family O-acyltransferase [Tsukamurella serpentis]